MYRDLGIHWASSIPAFSALVCVPFPFLFYKYGQPIRMKCNTPLMLPKYWSKFGVEVMRMKDGTLEVEECKTEK